MKNNEEVRLCLNCGIIGEVLTSMKWGDNIIEPYGSSDICESCEQDTVINVDSEIAHYIYRLNKMGYKTAYCCAGHSINNYASAYILFNNDCFDKLKSILTEEKLGYDITDEKSDVVLRKIKMYKDKSGETYYLYPNNIDDIGNIEWTLEYAGETCQLQVNSDFMSECMELAIDNGGYIYIDETMQARREFYKVLNIIMDSEEI